MAKRKTERKFRPGDRVFIEGEVLEDANHGKVYSVLLRHVVLRERRSAFPSWADGPEPFLVNAEDLRLA